MRGGPAAARTSGAESAERCPLLEVAELQAGYGMSRALFGVNLCAERGEVVALLGRNGAGKSTTLKAIMGIVPPTSGRVLLAGQELSGLPPHMIARAGIGYVPQDRRIFPGLTVRENLEVGRRADVAGEQRWSLERIPEVFPALGVLLHRQGESLSGGEQQMLAIARTLMGNPSILLLDEPSEGLAPMVVDSLAEQVLRLKREGVTIILSEQNLRFTMRVCDRGYMLEKGRVRHTGDAGSLLDDKALINKYLSL